MIRPVQIDDAPAIAQHRCPAEADAAERPIYSDWMKEAIQRSLYLRFLALDGEQIVSGAGLTLLNWGPSRGDPQPWQGRIVNVWTHPDSRRQGLVRGLVELCVDAARKRGITRLSLGTSAEALSLYLSLGFTVGTSEMTVILR